MHAFDEFSPLCEVVVGRIEGGQLPTIRDRSRWLNLYPDQPTQAGTPAGRLDERVVAETAEDLDDLAQTLCGLGVRVHRPALVDHTVRFATPDWAADGFYSYCPRDLVLVAGTTLIETPSPMRARFFETRALAPLFQAKMRAGAAWISAPKPCLSDELYPLGPDGLPTLGEAEPAFEAANILRCGRDLFYLVSGSGNEQGRRWLETTLAALGQDFRVHALRGVYRGTHIDSTICLLRPGLVLLNPSRVCPETIPDLLRGWDVVWCPPMTGRPTPSGAFPLSSEWIGMNLLMAAPDLALVDSEQSALIRELERHRIQVAPVRLRHARTLGGGVHCTTLDLVRAAPCVDYFA
ncbi:hypothetical protein KIK06_24910 [Nocardiopsis sp. EMB25]|uniref:hypothetical protein n=1 Tax=Nocardiopsis sp. EMB25 TaxID=2835867 RepID=UPI002283DC93|nr:hypothetical protein [Nocardiopsis sp. EMB25]MCY9787130.1 hypothetical protein [Nocardiopsis sp. EMB25]